MDENKSLLLSVDSAALNIENALQQILMPYPKGIYIKGNELPSITPDEYFYRIDRTGPNKLKEIQVTTIEQVVGNIYNEDAEIVITDRVAARKEQLLSTLPTVPAYGRQVARAVIRDILEFVQIYKRLHVDHFHIRQTFDKIINPNYNNPKTFRQFEDIVAQHTQEYIYNEIQRWCGARTWDILIPTFDRDTVRIDNKGDFRIHDWNEKFGSEFSHGRLP